MDQETRRLHEELDKHDIDQIENILRRLKARKTMPRWAIKDLSGFLEKYRDWMDL